MPGAESHPMLWDEVSRGQLTSIALILICSIDEQKKFVVSLWFYMCLKNMCITEVLSISEFVKTWRVWGKCTYAHSTRNESM